MNNLIYFPLDWLRKYDPFLCSHDYKHNKWFNMYSANMWPTMWPGHLTSRAHSLNTPWSLAPTICPIPEITNNSDLRFDVIMDSIASNLCDYINSSKKIPYLLWSGGIDSTSILVSLLKVAGPDVLRNLVVLHNEKSILENSFFYYHFIKDKISCINFDKSPFEVTVDNYDKILIIDGDAGNQMMGSPHINYLLHNNRHDILTQPWKTIDYRDIVPDATDFMIELIYESVEYAPVPIDNVADLLWWTAFNFKVDKVLLVKLPWWVRNLSPEQSKLFWNTGIFRSYSQPEMQIWSMITKDTRLHNCIPKYACKKYIYDFDNNDIWFAQKREHPSSGHLLDDTAFVNLPIIALDQDWNKYYISDPATRATLGQILQRT
jgi:hypothetical protein